MPRRVLIAAIFAAVATAAPPVPSPKGSAIWPDKLGTAERTSVHTVSPPSDPKLWDEYGFDTAEEAQYGNAFTGTAYRMKDPTGALSVYQMLRPAGAKPSKLGENAVSAGTSSLLLFGNYVIRFEKGVPPGPALKQLVANLPKLDQSSLPAIRAYLPDAGLIPNSERYVLGPESLERVEPRIPPSTAAFHIGAEAQSGKFQTRSGEANLLVFSYPTPALARERETEYRKLPGAVVKRAGPLVAVTFGTGSADDAERLLAAVKYQPDITWNESVPKATKAKDVANMLLGIVLLAVVLIVASVIFGVAFGGFRMVLSRFGIRTADEGFTSLNLSNK